MTESCSVCGSSDTTHTDSHRTYINEVRSKEVHYYECNDCGHEFAVTR